MERLYYADSYLTEFEAVIEKCLPSGDNLELLLSRTAFYPESGGQPSDHGWINDLPVLEVRDSEDGPLHLVSGGDFTPGQTVKGKILWDRRFDHMQHHTGQHLLSRAFVEVLGAETVSFHLGATDVTIDINRKEITDTELEKVEAKANQAVTSNLPVKIYYIDGSDQSEIPIRKPSKREGDIRIIEVEGWDYSPCGGTHSTTTGVIWMIKILNLETVRQNIRVHFKCGRRALEDYGKKTRMIRELARTLTCGEDDLADNLRKSLENSRGEARNRRKLQEKIIKLTAGNLAGNYLENCRDYRIVAAMVDDFGLGDLNKLASGILASGEADIVILASESPRPAILMARSEEGDLPDLRPVLEEVKGLFSGKGGGSAGRVQAGGTDPDGIRTALEKAVEIVSGNGTTIPDSSAFPT